MVSWFRKRPGSPTVAEVADSGGNAEPEITRASGSDTDSALEQLKKFKKTHQWDFNLDYDQIEQVNKVVDGGDTEKGASVEQTLLGEDSPYFEVRTAVRNYDMYAKLPAP